MSDLFPIDSSSVDEEEEEEDELQERSILFEKIRLIDNAQEVYVYVYVLFISIEFQSYKRGVKKLF